MNNIQNVPKMFTDEAINAGIANLEESISMWFQYHQREIDRANKNTDSSRQMLKCLEKCDAERCELRDLLPFSPFERMEKYYQNLIARKNTTTDEKNFPELAEKFRKMEGYKDTEVLAKECEEMVLKIQYDRLIKAKNKTLTEAEYQNLAEKFRKMNGYKNTTELARECDNQYYMLKENREKQEHIERERLKEEYRITQERKAAQEKKDQEERERLEAQARERHIIEKHQRRIGGIFAAFFVVLAMSACLIGEHLCPDSTITALHFFITAILAIPLAFLFWGKGESQGCSLVISIFFSIYLLWWGLEPCHDVERIFYVIGCISYTASWILAVAFRKN
jgi:hypothetical protein